MFSLFKNKSKKSGPLKALSSVFAREERAPENGTHDSNTTTTTTTTTVTTATPDTTNQTPSSPPPPPPKSSGGLLRKVRKSRQQYGSKDDLSALTTPEEELKRRKKKKVQSNPYATVKMWRPITMSSSVSHEDDAYRNFSNFDLLVAEAKLPATGDLRNDSFRRFDAASERQTGDSSRAGVAGGVGDNGVSGAGRENAKYVSTVAVSSSSSSPSKQAGSSNAARGGRWVNREESLSRPSSAVTIPLKPRTLTLEEQREQERTLVPPPRRPRPRPVTRSSTSCDHHPRSSNGGTDIPMDYYPMESASVVSSRARSVDVRDARRRSPDRKGRSIMESSQEVVGAEVSRSVRSVLSKTYGPEGFDAAVQDAETMLVHLKTTMETLKTSQDMVWSSGSQFQTVRHELLLQTKQFVLDAKALVGGATGSRKAISPHLHSAMHTLSRLLLHGQAMMVRMRSVHQAQHVGFEVLRVSASFKSTVAAANAALGRPITDPHMKYLMRQATNLAALLSTLLKTLKNLEQA